MSGAAFQDNRLTVELSQWHDNPAIPVIGAKREMYFPRPFGGRGGDFYKATKHKFLLKTPRMNI